MTLVSTSAERRLGLRAVVEDNVETWSLATGDARRSDRRRGAAWYYLVPTITALPFLFWRVELQGVAQLLAGVAVFTALLFALLGVVFNMGVTLRKDGAAISSAHDLRRVIADLRANITYAAVVGITLSLVIVGAAVTTAPASAVTTPPSTGGLAWWWAPPLVWLFVHLGLSLLTILRRFRTAFNYVTR